MPPKKSTRKASKPSVLPLEGCTIALSGTFPGHSQSDLEINYINALGATLSKTVTASITHLITTAGDFAKPSAKVKQAKSHDDISIVNLDWLVECLEQHKKLSEDDYSLDAPSVSASSTAPANGTGKANTSRKRSVATTDDAEDDASQTQPALKKRGRAAKKDVDDESSQLPSRTKANGSASQAQVDPPKAAQASKSKAVKAEPESKMESKLKEGLANHKTNIAQSMDVTIPVDETCPLTHFRVYIDDKSLIYDANLNQTNASNNNNKFYRVQLLHNGGNEYKTWARWGRVGERGQSSMLGNGSLDDAIYQFESKFNSKTGLNWSNRAGKPKAGKYTFVERSYVDDSDDEDNGGANVKTEDDSPAPESELDPAVQGLLELIFNQNYFAAAMTELNYDVKKLPLGKLGKSTITRGYQALKDLSELFGNASLAQTEYGTTFNAAIENLSNSYYSLIPHAFGRNRPPVINTQEMLKAEVDLLDSLSDMKDASNIMKKEPKDVERINALDRQFQGLNLDEMTPLRRDSTEFNELKDYLINTKGATHHANYQITQIFRIERQGERERFEKSPYAGPPKDRRLLWHGSRATNFGGILSQGLRIAPPEAPVSGYMFGKGIYLADMSSKSANYCCSYISNNNALLLLCEAELGNPMQTLTNASYTAGEDAKAKGMLSTWGQGLTGPSQWKDAEVVHPSLKGIKMPDITALPGNTGVKNAYLQYNEYIAYDVAQVRLRYLFQVKM
ncbi:poly-ribose polymerase-like protein [Tricladium varicosporioides]|nr:poly-ribose polymerase-like protein [Hymenoscyphus varicosporioides]